MKISKIIIMTMFVLGLFVLPTITSVAAKSTENPVETSFCGSEGFNCECQNFYNSTDYYAIEKWAVNGEDYEVDETVNSSYTYFNIHVTGDDKSLDWTSSHAAYSLLVKAGNDRFAFDGGLSGSVDMANFTKNGISHVTFCGHKINDGGCTGPDCGNHGVPEFPAFTIGVAVLVVTLGLVFLRKN